MKSLTRAPLPNDNPLEYTVLKELISPLSVLRGFSYEDNQQQTYFLVNYIENE